MSDQTNLTNFLGDKKAWPVSITIGNLPSARSNSRGSIAVLLLPLLPIHSKFSTSSNADKHLRKINADSLQDVFKLIFAPLQDVVHTGITIDCADGKVRQCFPILSVWIADHIENVALKGLKPNACPKCDVPTHGLGTNARSDRTRDYTRYQRQKRENQNSGLGSDDDHIMCDNPGISQNMFPCRDRVSASDLYKRDMLHTMYHGLLKHIMDWIEGFVKKYG